ncbi:Hexuronate transporter [Paraburkholderia caffeinitolerans]|uniref:Hexuronate transporter n=1 Tax=Paraburkholderia caffeinitolerans TaxID=1723730 RepID=A0A6J5GGX0_9BURK|nr:MFS transporter [Paraburkholderia caffeinitolerans]CAB3797688.1 Hexuronate transporter [Paraburkholderia caffeinitolerans]
MVETKERVLSATPHPAAEASLSSGRRWAVVASLFLFMAINFADKAVLGLVAVPLMHDMQLSPTQFGLVGSAFFLLFSVSGIATGVVADRCNLKWLIAALAFAWAVAQLPLGWPTTFAVLLLCRILLGAGEGPASPLALHVVYTWFDDHERNLPTTIVQQGATVGVIVSGPLLTFVAERWNWHAPFLFLGFASLAWLLLWLWVGDSGTHRRRFSEEPGAAQAAASPARRLPILPFFANRTIIGVMLQCFVGYAVISIGFTWTPAYLRLALDFPASHAAWIFAMQVAMQIPVGVALAMLSHRLLARGVPSRLARGAVISVVCVIAGIAYCAIYAGVPTPVKVALMAIASACAIQTFSFGPMLVAEVVPAERRGALLAITNSIVTLAGLLGPIAMGKLITSGHGASGYQLGFGVMGVLLVASGLAGFILLNPQRPAKPLRAESAANR